MTAFGLAEVGACAVLWRMVRAAPLVEFERDVELVSARRPRHERDVTTGARAV